ncbi:unnamed protein product, partial [Meganyctiphanes norvegica]
MPGADPHANAPHGLPMAYPQHQIKGGATRPEPPHPPPHHGHHPGPPGPPYPPLPHGPPHGLPHPSYNHHMQPPQQGQHTSHKPPQHAMSSQKGPPNSHGPSGPSGPPPGSSGLPPGPPGSYGSHSQRGPGTSQSSNGPHNQYIGPHGPPPGPHVHPSSSLNTRAGPGDGPSGESRHPPAYPEPPRYPGPQRQQKHQIPPGHQAKSYMGPPPGPLPPPGASGTIPPGAGSAGSGPSSGTGSESARLEEDLTKLNRTELMNRLLCSESDIRELQRSLHGQSSELRHLRENQQRLTDDNQSLRAIFLRISQRTKLKIQEPKMKGYEIIPIRPLLFRNLLRSLEVEVGYLLPKNFEIKELCIFLSDESRSHSCLNKCCDPLI